MKIYTNNKQRNRIPQLNDYYEDDVSLAITKLLAKNITIIQADGVYNAKTLCEISNKNNLKIVGNFEVKLENNLDQFLLFKNCSDISIDGLNFDGNEYVNHRVMQFSDCNNVELKNINIKNIKNVDPEKSTFNIFLHCNNFKLENINFNNITHIFNKANVTTGKGSIQHIYCSIDDSHKNGVIEKITSFNCYNIDSASGVMSAAIDSDCDIIKTQYYAGLTEENCNINSNIVIRDIHGINFGKRLVKLQTSGVIVENLKAELDNEIASCFSCIGIHSSNVLVRNIELSCKSAYCVIEIGYYNKDIDIDNVKFDGNLLESIVSISSVDSVARNIKISNIKGTGSCENGIIFNSDVDNVVLSDMDLNLICNNLFLNVNNYRCKNVNNFKLQKGNLNLNINDVCIILDIDKLNLEFDDIKFVHTKLNDECNRVITIKNIPDSEIIFNNINFKTDSSYTYGYIWTHEIDSVIYKNFNSDNSNVIIQNMSNTANYLDCNIINGGIVDETKISSRMRNMQYKDIVQKSVTDYNSRLYLEKEQIATPLRKNNPIAVAEMISVAKSYYSNRYQSDGVTPTFFYDTAHTPTSDQFDVTDPTYGGAIDCSTFIGMVLRGLPVNKSPYAPLISELNVDGSEEEIEDEIDDEVVENIDGSDTEWDANSVLANTNDYLWAINPFDWSNPITMGGNPYPIRRASQMAQWMYERGWSIPLDPTFSNVEPGDIIFWAKKDSSGNYTRPNRYMKISHVAMCINKKTPPADYPAGYPIKHTMFEVTTIKPYVLNRSLEKCSPGSVVMVCRPDLGSLAFENRACNISTTYGIDNINNMFYPGSYYLTSSVTGGLPEGIESGIYQMLEVTRTLTRQGKVYSLQQRLTNANDPSCFYIRTQYCYSHLPDNQSWTEWTKYIGESKLLEMLKELTDRIEALEDNQ